MPHLVDFATANGARAIYLSLAFDNRFLDETPPRKWNDRLDGRFVGGFTEAHTSGVDLILSALKTYPSLRLYGYGWEN